jgi:hypothetical protein
MKDTNNNELENAVDMIEQLDKKSQDKKYYDPEILMAEIDDMFADLTENDKTQDDNEKIKSFVDVPDDFLKKKKLKRRIKNIRRKNKFAYIAEQSVKAREEIQAAQIKTDEEAVQTKEKTTPAETSEQLSVDVSVKEGQGSLASEIAETINNTIEEISLIKEEKTQASKEEKSNDDLLSQIHSVEEKEPAKEEFDPEPKASEMTANEPVEMIEEGSEPEENTAVTDQTVTLQEETKITPGMPDIDLSRKNHAPIQRWEIFYVIGAFLLLISIYFGMTFINGRETDNSIVISGEPKAEEMQPEKHQMDPILREMWLANKAINSDYVGELIFDSGLINVPFVQAKSLFDRNGKFYTFYTEEGQLVQEDEAEYYNGNDVYIWTNWKTGKYDNGNDEGGSVFMDFRNNLNDQNLIIFGHHFARDWDPSGSKQFTPLDLLLEEENYEANKTLKLILDNEIREYVVTNVFTIDVDNEYEGNIMRRNMDEDYSGNADPGFFEGFIEYINEANKYAIPEKLSETDNILTLVTCIQHQPQYRQIVMCRETNRTIYK